MELTKSAIPGCFKIKCKSGKDSRGFFAKSFQSSVFLAQAGLHFVPHEVILSSSHANVIRGMHFQAPPKAQPKIVSCISGEVLDVVLDLRVGSPTFGVHETFILKDPSDAIFIPPGLAHGFLSKREGTNMLYLVENEFAPDLDSGIRYDSFGFNWSINEPIISDRDKSLKNLADFKSTFVFES